MELVLDAVAIMSSMSSMMLPPEQNLKQVIGESLYQQTLSEVQHLGLTDPVLQRFKPWAVAVTLSMPQMEDSFLDQRIYQQALENRQAVYGLETADEQLAVFDQMGDELQIQMLRDVLEQIDELDEQLESMVKTYLDRDLEKLRQLTIEYESSNKELMAWFEDKLIRDRNLLMAERLMEMLNTGETFVAVGALHLVGDSGLINTIEKEGYSVRPVY